MELDVVFVLLQSFKHPCIIFFVPGADGFLFGKLGFCLGEQSLFAGQFRFESRLLAVARASAISRALFGKARGRLGSRFRRRNRRHYGDSLALDYLAVLAQRLILEVGHVRLAGRIDATPDGLNFGPRLTQGERPRSHQTRSQQAPREPTSHRQERTLSRADKCMLFIGILQSRSKNKKDGPSPSFI